MDAAHHLVLLAGALGLLSIFAGLFLARFGTPLLLAFLAIGLLFGKQGPVGLVFNDFQTSYLIGSVALAVILFEGGLKTKRSMLKIALGPALAPPVTQQNRSSATRATDKRPAANHSTGDASRLGRTGYGGGAHLCKLLSSDQPSIEASAKCRFRHK